MHVSLPGETRANGTLFAVVYVHKAGVSPLEDSREVHYAVQLTTYITPLRTDVQKDKEKVHHHSGLHHISPSILPLHIFYIMWPFYGAQLPCTVHYLFIFLVPPRSRDLRTLYRTGDPTCHSLSCQRTSPSQRLGFPVTCAATWECKSDEALEVKARWAVSVLLTSAVLLLQWHRKAERNRYFWQKIKHTLVFLLQVLCYYSKGAIYIEKHLEESPL